MGLQRRIADLWQPWQPGHALVSIPLGLIVAITAADLVAPSNVHLGPLLVVAPAVTPWFAGTGLTAVIGGLAVAAQALISVLRGGFTGNHQAQIVALAVITVLLVGMCRRRECRRRELERVRSVSEATQRVVLRPLPHRMGPLRIASLYLAAEHDADIGGDLYAATRRGSGTRLIIGDVRGKGLTAIGDASALMGAFREAAHRCADLLDLGDSLETSICRHLAEHAEEHAERAARTDDPGDAEPARAASAASAPGPATGRARRPADEVAGEFSEHFVTALVLDIEDEDAGARMINCGHPPPLLLRDGEVRTLHADHPAPPLGMCGLPREHFTTDTFTFEDDDTLLLHTDGVLEARSPDGSFYPLAERVALWGGSGPEALLRHLRDDLVRHVGGPLRDDAAMVVIQRSPKLIGDHHVHHVRERERDHVDAAPRAVARRVVRDPDS
ncbi:PP2C family protein-serine/threonine phosphatase [Streptomyces sp. NPDC008238]